MEEQRINGIRVIHYNPGPREKLEFWGMAARAKERIAQDTKKDKTAEAIVELEKTIEEFHNKFGPKENE